MKREALTQAAHHIDHSKAFVDLAYRNMERAQTELELQLPSAGSAKERAAIEHKIAQCKAVVKEINRSSDALSCIDHLDLLDMADAIESSSAARKTVAAA